jgi:D-serine deaminase-like pyridoxal phosphate-dependent protein
MTPLPHLPAGLAAIPSPALILHWETVEENLRRMLALAPSPDRLRPHLKTHKLPQIVARLAELGVTKAKCATIAEAEMAASAGATDVLLAAPLVGPTTGRLLALMRAFPQVVFAGLADDAAALETVDSEAAAAGAHVRVMIDLDVGQHRTGIAPGGAMALYRKLAASRNLVPGGLHAYDGHLHQSEAAVRAAACDEAFVPVTALAAALRAEGLPVPAIVAGGTPTFPMHARRSEVECSPGTCVLWDAGYARNLPDLEFLPAAFLLTRVVSRPAPDRVCLDLGHKAVASEMAPPRVVFPALPDASPVMHNEEHLVLETPHASALPVGSVLIGIPWHICPTVALHAFVHVVRGGSDAMETWPVTARTRRITV